MSKNKEIELSQTIKAMVKTLHHRGPNHSNTFIDNYLALGHSRLSIIDTSNEAHQPYISPCQQYVLVFNGEIYNYQTLRKELLENNVDFQTKSDTEVLLKSIIKWGIEKALHKFNGMFSFAFYNKNTNQLFLARDRVGIKPLYYSYNKGVFSFASELKALQKIPFIKWELNSNAINNFINYSYIPSPETIYKNCFKLFPGSYLTLSLNNFDSYTLTKYWKNEDFITDKHIKFDKGQFKEILKESVKLRMQADVSLGAFLSGGIDSSLIVSLMSEMSPTKINTFSIGFEDNSLDESKDAKKIAKHLQTNHDEYILTSSDAMDIVPKLSYFYDEPFADSSQIPTMLVSSIAAKKVTVALSGDGGDELFGGYQRYFWMQKIQTFYKQPILLRKLQLKLLKLLLEKPINLLPVSQKLKYKVKKLIHILNEHKLFYDDFYKQSFNNKHILKEEIINISHLSVFINEKFSVFEQAMLVDLLAYLPDDILTKVDRASMANSLEVRTPLLDHQVVKYAWSLPLQDKVKGTIGKLPLRAVLNDYLPENLINNQKKGFAVPLASWLRNSLNDWGSDLLHSKLLKNDEFLNESFILNMWKSHQKKRKKPSI